MTVFTDLGSYLQYVNQLNVGTGTTTTPLGTALTSTTTPGLTSALTALQQNNTIQGVGGVTPSATLGGSTTDDRVRIAHLSGYSNPYPGIQAPLQQTQGMLFPYAPTIQIAQEVDYGNMQMTHSNTNYYYYSRTPNAQITITGKFTVQNQTEGAYAIASLQFLRGVSKMNFGQEDANAGLPPPILTLNGYGDYMFKNVRVFVKTHNYSYDENMDTVKVNLGGTSGTTGTTSGSSGTVRLPALFTLSVTLVTQPTVQMMRKNFSLDDYRSGKLLSDGKGFF